MSRTAIGEGTLCGHAYRAIGEGPPVVFLVPLNVRLSTGLGRLYETRFLEPLTRRFTVHWLARRPGAPMGTTMADFASQAAEAIRAGFDGPVDVLGASTGGSLALQLAAGHPDLVRRLALVAGACSLGGEGARLQRRCAELLAAGRPRAAMRSLAGGLVRGRVARELVGGLTWLLAGRVDEPAGLAALLMAEDAFGVCDRLADVTARTLIVAAEHDAFYPRDLAERTAAGIPDSRLLVYPRTNHRSAIPRSRADVIAFFSAG